MGSTSAFQPARLVVGLLSSPSAPEAFGVDDSPIATALEERFGPSDAWGPELDFPWSAYYDEEMGGRPRRSFLSFSRLVDPAELASIKAFTNALEGRCAVDGKRRYNLDPGLLSLDRFVLATTKNRPHRIPIASGIYAELTLIYESGDFRALAWTYPDWASEEYRAFLRELRERLKRELRSRALPFREEG
jgi:hypothetical protein